MKDWTGIAVIVLALLIFVLYGLYKDRDPRQMNPRLETDKGTKKWAEFQGNNFIAVILSFLSSYLLIQCVKWVSRHWQEYAGGAR